MENISALKTFLKGAIAEDKSRRYLSLLDTKNGNKKLIDELHHQFESHIRGEKVVHSFDKRLMEKPCFIYGGNRSFGMPHNSITEAYDLLSHEDSWLIVSTDGTIGIFRPEDRWDDTKWIKI
jgi:hypothetical protein